jgi:hypothetical protein
MWHETRPTFGFGAPTLATGPNRLGNVGLRRNHDAGGYVADHHVADHHVADGNDASRRPTKAFRRGLGKYDYDGCGADVNLGACAETCRFEAGPRARRRICLTKAQRAPERGSTGALLDGRRE